MFKFHEAVLLQVDLRCPTLLECKLGPGLESKLKQVHLASRSLRSISWHGLEALSDVQIACPSLKVVCDILSHGLPAQKTQTHTCYCPAVKDVRRTLTVVTHVAVRVMICGKSCPGCS